MSATSLYRSLLKEAAKFSTVNYRMYAVRRIRFAFKESKGTDVETSTALLRQGEVELASLRRQVTVSQLYPA